MKKLFAFVLDIISCFILMILASMLMAGVMLVIAILFIGSDLKPLFLDIVEIFDFCIKIGSFWGYFVFLPRKLGNTPAAKFLKIQDYMGWFKNGVLRKF